MNTSPLKQLKTLVVLVGNDRRMLMPLKLRIEEKGYPVILAESPYEAISFVMDGLERPAIFFITDVPEFDYDASQLIRHLEKIRVHPLLSIYIADDDDPSLFGNALESGAIACLSKTSLEGIVGNRLALCYVERMDRLIQEELLLAERLDPLTGVYGVYDREGGRRKFRGVWREARKKNTVTSAVFVDVNGLKEVNTTYGKEYGYTPGDKVILALARLLRSSDMVIRFGGDEFFVILQATVKSKALKVLRRLKSDAAAVSVEILPNVHFRLSLSGGVFSILPRQLGDSPDALFERMMAESQKLERKDKQAIKAKSPITTRING